MGLQKQKTQKKKEAENRGPIEKEAARAGLSKEEAKEMSDGEEASKAAEEKLGKHSHCQTGGKPVREHNYRLGSYRFTGTQLCYTNGVAGSEEAQV